MDPSEIDRILNQEMTKEGQDSSSSHNYEDEESGDSQTDEYVNFVLSEIIKGNVSISEDQPVHVTHQNNNDNDNNNNNNNQGPSPDQSVGQFASNSIVSQGNNASRNAAVAQLDLGGNDSAVSQPLTATVQVAGKKVIIPLGQPPIPSLNNILLGIPALAAENIQMGPQVPAAEDIPMGPQVPAAENIPMGPQVPAAENIPMGPQAPAPATGEIASASTTHPPVAESLPAADPSGSKKRKLYEEGEFQDPQMEKKRKNAINAKNHRDKTKQQIQELKRQLGDVESERNEYKSENESLKTDNQQLKEELAEALRREQEREAVVREIASLREENARLRQQAQNIVRQHLEEEEQSVQQDKMGMTDVLDFFPDDFFNF